MKIFLRSTHIVCLITCVILSSVLCSLPAFSFSFVEYNPKSWHKKLTDYNEFIQVNGDFMVDSETANIYGHPWIKSPILAVLNYKTSVTLLGSYNDDWLHVSIGAITGWMRADQLFDYGQEGGWAGISLGNTFSRVQTNNPNSKVNLHPLPYVDSGDLGSYPRDRLVRVLGRTDNNEWYLVQVSGEDGFMGFISASKLGKMLYDGDGRLASEMDR